MPINSTINHDERMVHTKLTGLITIDELIEFQSRIWALPDVYGFNELFDAREVDTSQLSYADLLTMAERATRLLTITPESKAAVILSSSHQKELYNFYRSAKKVRQRNTRELRTFSTPEEGLSWLLGSYSETVPL